MSVMATSVFTRSKRRRGFGSTARGGSSFNTAHVYQKDFRPAVCKIFLCTQSTPDGIPRQAHCKGGVTIIVSRTHNLQIRSSTVYSGTVWFIRLTEIWVSTLLFIHRDVPWAQERRELVRAKFEGSYRRYFCCWSPLILHDSCFNKESSKLNGALVLGVNGGARLPVSVWNDS